MRDGACMARRRLIINADDFGLSPEVNAAVVEAHRFGTLTSCSLMVAGAAAQEAIALACSHPRLSVGLHLVTALGRSVLPHREIPSLVDREGRFSSDPTAAGLRYFFSGKARRDLRKELTAQIERFFATGLHPTHLDSHLHMHLHPVIFQLVLELSLQHGIRCVRVPEDRLWVSLQSDRARWFTKVASALVFRCFTGRMKTRLRSSGIRFAKRVYGHLMTGRMTEAYVLSVVENLEPGTNEMYFHPARHPASLQLSPSQAQCRKEFDILQSGALAGRIRELGIELIGYRELDKEL